MKEKDITDPEELLHVYVGLDQDRIVKVLNDTFTDMADLYALVDAIPRLERYMGGLKAPDLKTEEKWKYNARILKELREKDGETLLEQAKKFRISESELEAIESGKMSPSFSTFRNMQHAYPEEIGNRILHIGILSLGQEIEKFVISHKWRFNRLSSQTRIPIDRIYKIINGEKPTQNEMKKLNNLINGLPSWVPPKIPSKQSKEKLETNIEESTNIESNIETNMEQNQPIEQEIRSTNVWDPFDNKLVTDQVSIEQNESAPINDNSIVTTPVRSTKAASDFEYLTDEERYRVKMCEEALLKLISEEKWKRSELFPDDKSETWPKEFLRNLVTSQIIVKEGIKISTRYIGIKDRIEQLIYDSEWLLKLVVPSALSRVTPEEDVHKGDVNEPKSIEESIPDSSPISGDTISEIGRLLPQYYSILSWQHERIENLEKSMVEVHTKLDQMISLLKK